MENAGNLEYLWLNVKFNGKKICICVIYRSPRSKLQDCLQYLDSVLPKCLVEFDNIILLGDFNSNFLENDNKILESLSCYGFQQVIKEPTRVSAQACTLIDPIFVLSPYPLLSAGTLNADLISDHHLVFCKLTLRSLKTKAKLISFRDFNQFNQESFFHDLTGVNWDEIFYVNNIDSKVSLLTEKINQLFDLHAPYKQIRVNKPFAPWLTDSLKLILKQRDEALAKFRSDRNTSNWKSYQQLRNYALASIRREKAGYLEYLQQQNKPKELWKTLKAMKVQQSSNVSLPTHLQDVTAINAHFTSVYNKSDLCKEAISFYNNNLYSAFAFTLKPVDTKTVEEVLFSIKSNAAGSDGITLHMLKLCLPTILPHITHIVSCCLDVGYFPLNWKLSFVTPLPKVSTPACLNDLRPISLLCVLSKILEKVVYQQVVEYANEHKIIPKHQSGFRKGYSTTSALSNLTDNIIRARDKKMASVLISLDYSKAFDCLDHDLILAKLHYYGFDNKSVAFFNFYLKDRQQTVTLNGIYSPPTNIISGVPQGSILGPLLFLLYSADLSKNVTSCDVQMYADDTQITSYFFPNFLNIATQEINKDLETIYKFSTEHNLKLNPDKSTVILFAKENILTQLKTELKLKINGTALNYGSISKNLGLLVDENLRFKEHVSVLLKKAYTRLRLLYNSKHILNLSLKKKLCECLVLSIFQYAFTVYFPCLDQITAHRIQKIQNSCCRFIFSIRKYDHVSAKIMELKWLKMNQRFKYNLLTFVHKILCTSIPSYLREKLIFRENIHEVNIRHYQMLTMPLHSTAIFNRSFTYNSILLYNSLPLKYKKLSVSSFHKEIYSYCYSLQH
nr:unnamed protein product [Callosobruchus chinensis]